MATTKARPHFSRKLLAIPYGLFLALFVVIPLFIIIYLIIRCKESLNSDFRDAITKILKNDIKLEDTPIKDQITSNTLDKDLITKCFFNIPKTTSSFIDLWLHFMTNSKVLIECGCDQKYNVTSIKRMVYELVKYLKEEHELTNDDDYENKLKQLRNKNLRDCFLHFEQDPYRMQFTARIHGIEFINDAISRTPNATWYSLETVDKAVIWIANGDNNETDFTSLIPLALRKIRMLICVGTDNHRLHDVFSGIIPTIIDAGSIKEAVSKALYSDIENGVVLFSPACENGKSINQQGEEFKREVYDL